MVLRPCDPVWGDAFILLTPRAASTADGLLDGQSSDDEEPGRRGGAVWRQRRAGTLPTIHSSESLLTVRVQRCRRVCCCGAAFESSEHLQRLPHAVRVCDNICCRPAYSAVAN